MVTDIERPDCSILKSEGVCGLSSLNTANCSLYKWSSVAEVTFSGTYLTTISSTVGPSVILTYENITDLSNGPLNINISGDCCNPALRINVIDVDGFISQCELSFSNGESVQSVEIVSTPINKSKTDFTIIIIATIVGVIAVCIVSVIAWVLHSSRTKVKEDIDMDEYERKPDTTK